MGAKIKRYTLVFVFANDALKLFLRYKKKKKKQIQIQIQTPVNRIENIILVMQLFFEYAT